MLIPLAQGRPAARRARERGRHRERLRGGQSGASASAASSYASSAAVYAPASGTRVAEDAPGTPATHYGVHKLANEGAARVYWLDDGVPSVGLRPYVVYGPGRDQGITAGRRSPWRAAARGEAYQIGFGGRVAAPLRARRGAGVHRRGARAARRARSSRTSAGRPSAWTRSWRRSRRRRPEAAGSITFDETPLPFPEEFLGGAPRCAPTPLATASARRSSTSAPRSIDAPAARGRPTPRRGRCGTADDGRSSAWRGRSARGGSRTGSTGGGSRRRASPPSLDGLAGFDWTEDHGDSDVLEKDFVETPTTRSRSTTSTP